MKQSGIVAFAFSVRKFGQNLWISTPCLELAKQLNAPIFTQREFVDIPPSADAEFVTETRDKPAPTLRIAREAVAWAIRRNINHIWIVAGPPHIRRCVRDLQYAIRERGLIIHIDVYRNSTREYRRVKWFTKDAGQPRTRSRLVWYTRELIIVLLPWLYRRLSK